MAKKGENAKKVAGNAKKAEAANKKLAEANAKSEAVEATEWEKGSKKQNKKAEEAQLKKEEAARKKAERDLLLQAEEASIKSKPRGAAKQAVKKAGKIDDFLDFNKDVPELSASGLDAALEALALTSKDGGVTSKDIDRHPERRVKAAYKSFEDRRLPEIRKEHPGLRLQQLKQLLFKEFQKSPENPIIQETNIKFNASKNEIEELKSQVKQSRESKFH
jgi:membrane protein involved in colicin uptake